MGHLDAQIILLRTYKLRLQRDSERNKPEKSHSCTVLVIIQCVIFLVKAFSCFYLCQEVPVLKRTWEN